VTQGEGPEFKPQYCKKKKKNIYIYIKFKDLHLEQFYQAFL
jgi:hypothetical protein